MIRIPYLREIGGLIARIVLCLVVWKSYGWANGNGFNAANVRAEKIIAEFAKSEAAAHERARKIEQDMRAEIAALDERHERGLQDAENDARRLGDAYRAGDVRLRKHWAGCETDRLSGSAEAARLIDEARQLQAESLERIAGIAGEADAKERGLQEYAKKVSQ